MDASDATQQLLTSLGRFQRELTHAMDGSDGWAEECMNQLIDCVEVSLPRGWSEMVEALTDTGRILQTYETAGRVQDAVDFLNEAYELLCLMVGDLIVDSIRPTVMKQWREKYQRAVAKLEQEGLNLVADDVEPQPAPQVVPFRSRAASETVSAPDLPFEMPDETVSSDASEELLPTLDELPPLDSVLGTAPSTPLAKPTASETPAKRRPSRLVIEILDQLCEQLSIVESGDAAAAAYALDRFTGGIRALEREARDDNHDLAVELCGLMLRAARLAKTASGEFKDGLSELGYAFCGAYMDAFREEDLETVSDWRVECKALVSEWERGEQQPAEPAVQAVAAEPEIEDIEVPDADEIPVEIVQSEPAPIEASADIEIVTEPLAESPVVVDAPKEVPAENSTPEEPTVDETSSASLLDAAQKAALRGDAANAKRYALQAASAIARDEVRSVERTLRQTKERLKAGLEAMREAREYVGETEKAVKEISTSVNAGEIALGKAREESGQISQQLSDLREGVSEIERQIAELQERREQELEKVARTQESLIVANRAIADSESELAERRAAEAAARTDLETRRQAVNDLQRTTVEIESEVDQTSQLLDEKQKSFDDITEAIQQICGGSKSKSQEEGLLF